MPWGTMIERGDIFFVDLDPALGREQRGRRPVLIVSSDALNSQPLVVVVVAGTDAANVPRDYPTNLRVTAAESGLPRDTVFLCFQVRALDSCRFSTSAGVPLARAGRLPGSRLPELERALKLVFDLT
ncbi:MAG: Endoribonuclease MazF [Thermoanaerobaculia bacterium]|nr:Endoribonuclease MazF [Thermoanaerobaculia bacterium]